MSGIPLIGTNGVLPQMGFEWVPAENYHAGNIVASGGGIAKAAMFGGPSIRLRLATDLAQAIIQAAPTTMLPNEIASEAFDIADALMAQEARRLRARREQQPGGDS